MLITDVLYSKGERIVDEAKSFFEEEQIEAETEILREDNTAEAILEYSRDFDLVVIGAHGENARNSYSLNEETKKILRNAERPTLVAKKTSPLLTLLVCIDESKHSADVLRYAAGFSQKMGSKITLLNVKESGAQLEKHGATGEISNSVLMNVLNSVDLSDLKVEKLVEYGSPSDVIADVAQKRPYDLIVLGRKRSVTVKMLSLEAQQTTSLSKQNVLFNNPTRKMNSARVTPSKVVTSPLSSARCPFLMCLAACG